MSASLPRVSAAAAAPARGLSARVVCAARAWGARAGGMRRAARPLETVAPREERAALAALTLATLLLALAAVVLAARPAAAQPSLTVTTNALRTAATATAADLAAGQVDMGSVTFSYTCPRRSVCTVYVHADAVAVAPLRVRHSVTNAWVDVGPLAAPAIVDEQTSTGQARTFTGRVVAFAYAATWSTAPATYVTPTVRLSVQAR